MEKNDFYSHCKPTLPKLNTIKKNSMLELWRFLASLLIMSTHMYHFGIDNYYFRETWIFVEFFLIITGYFTTKHFDETAYENKMQAALKYTWIKFRPLIPYTTIATISAYILYITQAVREHDISRVIGSAERITTDILLITESYQTPLVLPLWYLSAMAMVFPLFSVFVQMRNRYWILYISFIYPVVFYGLRGVTGGVEVPHDLLRVMAGLLLGTFIYEINMLFEDLFNKIAIIKLTIAEVLLLVTPTINACMHWPLRRLNLLLFVFGLGILLSGKTFMSRISNGLMDFLGKLSVPIYTIHWVIGTIINILIEKGFLFTQIEEIIIYYLSTIIIALLQLILITQWKNRIKRKLSNISDWKSQ